MGDSPDEQDSDPGSDGHLALDLVDHAIFLNGMARVLRRLSGMLPSVGEDRKAERDWIIAEAVGLRERERALWENVIWPRLERHVMKPTGRPPWAF